MVQASERLGLLAMYVGGGWVGELRGGGSIMQ